MHDPMTLAFDVRLGKVRLLEIWHVDPETDGSDDSCGWTYPHLTEDEGNYAHSLIYDKFDNVKNWFASSELRASKASIRSTSGCWWCGYSSSAARLVVSRGRCFSLLSI